MPPISPENPAFRVVYTKNISDFLDIQTIRSWMLTSKNTFEGALYSLGSIFERLHKDHKFFRNAFNFNALRNMNTNEQFYGYIEAGLTFIHLVRVLFHPGHIEKASLAKVNTAQDILARFQDLYLKYLAEIKGLNLNDSLKIHLMDCLARQENGAAVHELFNEINNPQEQLRAQFKLAMVRGVTDDEFDQLIRDIQVKDPLKHVLINEFNFIKFLVKNNKISKAYQLIKMFPHSDSAHLQFFEALLDQSYFNEALETLKEVKDPLSKAHAIIRYAKINPTEENINEAVTSVNNLSQPVTEPVMVTRRSSLLCKPVKVTRAPLFHRARHCEARSAEATQQPNGKVDSHFAHINFLQLKLIEMLSQNGHYPLALSIANIIKPAYVSEAKNYFLLSLLKKNKLVEAYKFISELDGLDKESAIGSLIITLLKNGEINEARALTKEITTINRKIGVYIEFIKVLPSESYFEEIKNNINELPTLSERDFYFRDLARALIEKKDFNHAYKTLRMISVGYYGSEELLQKALLLQGDITGVRENIDQSKSFSALARISFFSGLFEQPTFIQFSNHAPL